MPTFNCSVDLFYMPIMDLIHNAGDRRAGHDLLREAIFLRLLSYCANGFNFSGAQHFARITCTPTKQAELIWDLCVNENILTLKDSTYSAKDWMLKNKLLAPTKREQKQEQQTEDNQLQDETPIVENQVKEIEPQPVTQQVVKSHQFSEVKEAVRPNVFLYRSEIEALKREYSDSEITKMLDILSDYKRQKNREYDSDYDAIKRWVYKRVDDKQSVKPQKAQISELPDWVF